MVVKKFSNAFRGLFLAIQSDRGFQFQLLFFVVTAPVLAFLFNPLTSYEFALLVICYGFLFITELQNTALEKAIDRLHPERNDLIRDSKDIAASSVLVSLLVFSCIVLLIALERGSF